MHIAKEKYDFIITNHIENQDNLIAYAYACSLFDQGVILFRLGENERAQALINELKQQYPLSRAAKLADQIRVP